MYTYIGILYDVFEMKPKKLLTLVVIGRRGELRD